jgi:hypothetical protein
MRLSEEILRVELSTSLHGRHVAGGEQLLLAGSGRERGEILEEGGKSKKARRRGGKEYGEQRGGTRSSFA